MQSQFSISRPGNEYPEWILVKKDYYGFCALD